MHRVDTGVTVGGLIFLLALLVLLALLGLFVA